MPSDMDQRARALLAVMLGEQCGDSSHDNPGSWLCSECNSAYREEAARELAAALTAAYNEGRNERQKLSAPARAQALLDTECPHDDDHGATWICVDCIAALARAAYNEGLEDAAKRAANWQGNEDAEGQCEHVVPLCDDCGECIAAAIRGMKGGEPAQTKRKRTQSGYDGGGNG